MRVLSSQSAAEAALVLIIKHIQITTRGKTKTNTHTKKLKLKLPKHAYKMYSAAKSKTHYPALVHLSVGYYSYDCISVVK